MRGARLRALVGVLLGALVCACAPSSPHPPSAVAVAEPDTVCLGDDHRTPILLDARESAQRLTLVPEAEPPDLPPLTYAWVLEGDDVRIIDGDMASEQLTVTMAGERPLHVYLRVESAAGGTSDTAITVSVTQAEDGAEVACSSDRECGPCRSCVESRCALR